MHERTQMFDTKDLMVAFYKMKIKSYRLPLPGKLMEELTKILKNKKHTIKCIHSDNDYTTYFWYKLICVIMPDTHKSAKGVGC